jgi:hypothetical protein
MLRAAAAGAVMLARLAFTALLIAIAPLGVALAQSQVQQLNGTWILFDDAEDPELARLAAAGATVPRDQLEATRRIVFDGTTATVHAAGATVTLSFAPTETEWGIDAQVSALDGTGAPINFLRIQFGEPGQATLTTFRNQVELERFAMLKVRATP